MKKDAKSQRESCVLFIYCIKELQWGKKKQSLKPDCNLKFKVYLDMEINMEMALLEKKKWFLTLNKWR